MPAPSTLPLALALALAAVGPAPAQASGDVHARAAELAACFDASAKRWSVDPELLRAIARVESNFNPQATNRNTDGSVDFGVMQVNSSHLPRLQRYGITSAHLMQQPCLNVDVGAWILADSMRQFGPTWRAVGAYGAGNAAHKEPARSAYAGKVHRALAGLSAADAPQRASTSLDAPPARVVAQMQVIE